MHPPASPDTGASSATPTPTTPNGPKAPAVSAGGTTPTTSTTPTTITPSSSRSATGQVEQYQYGDLSVTVTEKSGHITDVQMASLNETDARSVFIDDQAIPLLRQQVLAAQSANIDGVSGATFTSQAYAQSVQSALDQLGLR